MQARATNAFVGRARELAALERAVDAAGTGRGGTVLIAGHAGSGKTRLASEMATRARRARFDVLLGRRDLQPTRAAGVRAVGREPGVLAALAHEPDLREGRGGPVE
jgi:MoxR-like ATPase